MSRRECKVCGDLFESRLPGSGVKASLCSVRCERIEQQQKAYRRENAKRARQQRTRTGVDGETRGWPLTVFDLYGTDCLSCGKPAQCAHHLVPRQVIMAATHLTPAERQALEFDPVQGIPLDNRCHELHETGTERLYFNMIPAPAIQWAHDYGFSSRVFDDRIYLGAPTQEEAA